MPNILILGVDPGLSGGLAALVDDEVYAIVMPTFKQNATAKREIDIQSICSWLDSVRRHFVVSSIDERIVAFIEQVGAMPGQGVTSMFTFGRVYGEIIGAFKALSIPIVFVPPKTWKNNVLGSSAPHDKAEAVDFVRQRFPDLVLLPTPRSRKPSDGIAEAVCIALYGLNYLTKTSNEQPKTNRKAKQR